MESVPPPPPPPPPVAAVGDGLGGLNGVASEFLSEKDHVLQEHRTRHQQALKKLEVSGKEYDKSMTLDLSVVDWSTATHIACSSSGSGGVLFVSFAENKRVVLKGTLEPARETFAARVMRRLLMCHPHVRPIGWTELERKKIEEMRSRLGEELGEADMRMTRMLNRPVIIAMEFVKGTPLPEALIGGKIKEKGFEALGEVVAFDCFTNNFDRLPLGELWSNDGNFDNFLVDAEGLAVAIDSAIYPIRSVGPSNAQYLKFLTRLKEISLQTIAGEQSGKVAPCIARLSGSMTEVFGVVLSESENLAIQRGLVRGMERIAETCNEEFLLKEKEAVQAMVHADWEDVWKKDVAAIDVDFLLATRAVFVEQIKGI